MDTQRLNKNLSAQMSTSAMFQKKIQNEITNFLSIFYQKMAQSVENL